MMRVVRRLQENIGTPSGGKKGPAETNKWTQGIMNGSTETSHGKEIINRLKRGDLKEAIAK